MGSSFEPGDPNRDPYFPIWRGDDEPLCSELCLVLEEAGILHRRLHPEDHLLRLPNQPFHEVAVPGSLFEKAEAAIAEAFGKDEASGEAAVAVLPSPFPRYEPDPMERDLLEASIEVWSGGASPQQEMVPGNSSGEPRSRPLAVDQRTLVRIRISGRRISRA